MALNTIADNRIGNTVDISFLIRMAQCIARQEIDNRDEANQTGRQIANFALANWDRVVERYGYGGADDMEIIERLARDMVRIDKPIRDEFAICDVMLAHQASSSWLA